MRYQCDVCPDYKARKLEFVATHKLRKHGVMTETFQKYECDVQGCDFYTVFDTMMALHKKRMHCKVRHKHFFWHSNYLVMMTYK